MSKKLLSLFVFLFTASTAGWSQCAMCKAVVESDMENGGTTAAGLNSGILYLMVFPYLLIATIGFFYYRHKKQQAAQNNPGSEA